MRLWGNTIVMQQKIRNTRSGSFSIEIALIYPFVVIILFIFVWQMSAIRCEMLYRSIILKETEKICFVGVLEEYSIKLLDIIGDDLIEESTAESLLNIAYELSLRKNIRNSYELLNAKNKSFLPILVEHMEFFECGLNEEIINLTCIYKIYTPFKILNKKFIIPLRFWKNGDMSGKINQENETRVWDLDNFERGKILRRRFGGNLPFGFPVLSGYSNGNALIIKSMDINKPTWKSPDAVLKEMKKSIYKIRDYGGTNVPWGREEIFIEKTDIKNKYIKFIIPEDYEADLYSECLSKIIETGSLFRIKVEIILYQKSMPNQNRE